MTEINGRMPLDPNLCIGARIRLRRAILGLSQQALGQALGISHQQIQKYENGTDRISGSRFIDLARTLEVSVSYFFGDGQDAASVSERPEPDVDGLATRPESVALLRAYYALPDDELRRGIRDLLTAMLGVPAAIAPATPDARPGVAAQAPPSCSYRQTLDLIRRNAARQRQLADATFALAQQALSRLGATTELMALESAARGGASNGVLTRAVPEGLHPAPDAPAARLVNAHSAPVTSR